MADGDVGAFLQSLSSQPLAPEFDLDKVLQAAQGQIRQQGEEGTTRALQFGATRGLSGPQTTDLLATQRGNLAQALSSAGLRAGLARSEAQRADRLNRERLRFMGAQYLEQLREARRVRSLGLIQSLASVAGTAAAGAPGLLAAGGLRQQIIKALGGLLGLGGRGEEEGSDLASSLSDFGGGAPIGSNLGFQGGPVPRNYGFPSLSGAAS